MSLDASNFPYPCHSCYILTFIRLGWLGVSQQRWTWVFNVYRSFTDFGISNVLPQPGSFALDLHVTLEFRPLGILLPYSVFGSAGFIEISILLSLRWVKFFFFFNLLPNSHPFHLHRPLGIFLPYSVFGSAGFIEISILSSLRWVKFFFFSICCLTLARFTYKFPSHAFWPTIWSWKICESLDLLQVCWCSVFFSFISTFNYWIFTVLLRSQAWIFVENKI